MFKAQKRQSGYSIWALIGTLCILAVLGFITLDKFVSEDKLPKQISYLPTAPTIATANNFSSRA